MAERDRERWDLRHSAEPRQRAPSSFLREIFQSSAWIIPRGRALDVAAGKGRNALFLAESGFDVEAIDISAVALDQAHRRAEKRGLRVAWRLADLEQIELPPAAYDLIVNFNYLQRSLLPQIKSALKIGGHVIFETYLVDQQRIGHPSNPVFLLAHNELLESFRDFRVLLYREGQFREDGEGAFRAGLFAQRLA